MTESNSTPDLADRLASEFLDTFDGEGASALERFFDEVVRLHGEDVVATMLSRARERASLRWQARLAEARYRLALWRTVRRIWNDAPPGTAFATACRISALAGDDEARLLLAELGYNESAVGEDRRS